MDKPIAGLPSIYFRKNQVSKGIKMRNMAHALSNFCRGDLHRKVVRILAGSPDGGYAVEIIISLEGSEGQHKRLFVRFTRFLIDIL